jgi:NADH-quinone oxidoreductase subunit L
MDEHTKHHIHESPATMTVPLTVLAAGSVLAGWIGVPKALLHGGPFQAFEEWLAPVFEHGHEAAAEGAHGDVSAEYLLMALSVLVALTGITIAYRVYMKMRAEDRPSGGPLYKVLLNKWYVDEIYDFVFIRGLSLGGGSLMARFDSKIVDGGVNGAGWMTRMLSSATMLWDTYVVDGLVNLTAFVVKALSFPMRFLQTGFVQSYALAFVLGLAAMFGYYWWGR